MTNEQMSYELLICVGPIVRKLLEWMPRTGKGSSGQIRRERVERLCSAIDKFLEGESMANPLFAVHLLNDQGKERAQQIADAFDQAFARLEILIPATTREAAIMRTKLEEACFYAKKAMAMDPANQQG